MLAAAVSGLSRVDAHGNYEWVNPTGHESIDGKLIVGRRIRVDGRGCGYLLSFHNSRLGASAHRIAFDDGRDEKICLKRKRQ